MAKRKIIISLFYLYCYGSFILVMTGCNNKLKIERLEALSGMRDNIPPTFADTYIISNYTGDIYEQKFVDSFICQRLTILESKYSYFYIQIYKESKVSNIKNLTLKPNLIDSPNWMTGEESAEKDLLQAVSFNKNRGYSVSNYNLKFSCDTTYYRKRKNEIKLK